MSIIRIDKIVIERETDPYGDNPPDHLGTFSGERGKFAVLHDKNGTKQFKYFNADNVENEAQARENYLRAMEFINGNVWECFIRATATIATSDDGRYWLTNTIKSGGLYGIDSDSGEDYFQEVGRDELEALRDALRALSFIDETIDAAPIEYKL
jgi:hypothetical protein